MLCYKIRWNIPRCADGYLYNQRHWKGCDNMASYNMATVHFEGRHLHSANTLTVYIDDVRKFSYQGGRTRSIEVAPGSHIIRISVYNDSSEAAYWLGPFPVDLEAGMEYDFSPGKSDSASGKTSYNRNSAPAKTGTRGCSGCLISIIIVIAVAVGGSLLYKPISGHVERDTKNATEQEAHPKDGTPDNRNVEQSGFVFPNSSTQQLEQSEVEGLSDSSLTYAINELYARRGYIFQSDELRGYYEQFSWYTGKVPANEFSVDMFNSIEQENLILLVKERDKRKEAG